MNKRERLTLCTLNMPQMALLASYKGLFSGREKSSDCAVRPVTLRILNQSPSPAYAFRSSVGALESQADAKPGWYTRGSSPFSYHQRQVFDSESRVEG